MARASYLMVERGHGEDDAGFRQRLDETAEWFRDKRHAWADQASQMGNAAREKGAETAGRARDLFQEHPLIGGLLAAAFGAIAGTTVPMTRMENEKLSAVGACPPRRASRRIRWSTRRPIGSMRPTGRTRGVVSRRAPVPTCRASPSDGRGPSLA